MLVARTAQRSPKLYQQQAFTVIASTLPPLVAGTLHVLDRLLPGLNLLPMSFLLTGCVYFTSLFRYRLFDLLPIARDVLIERMSDGAIVLDSAGRILDINPAAQQAEYQARVELHKTNQSLAARLKDIEALQAQLKEQAIRDSRKTLAIAPKSCGRPLRQRLLGSKKTSFRRQFPAAWALF